MAPGEVKPFKLEAKQGTNKKSQDKGKVKNLKEAKWRERVNLQGISEKMAAGGGWENISLSKNSQRHNLTFSWWIKIRRFKMYKILYLEGKFPNILAGRCYYEPKFSVTLQERRPIEKREEERAAPLPPPSTPPPPPPPTPTRPQIEVFVP